MFQYLLERTAPLEYLNLWKFSEHDFEGQKVLGALAASNLNTLKLLNLQFNDEWWVNEICVQNLCTILNNQNQL